VQQLNDQRNKYIASETAKQQQGKTLGSAVQQAIRGQAQKKNYTFKPGDNQTDPNEAATVN
jgi:hypothetical protein